MNFVDHGGDIAAQALLYVLVCENPEATLPELLQLCQQHQLLFGATLDWIQKTISRAWGWTWRTTHVLAQ